MLKTSLRLAGVALLCGFGVGCYRGSTEQDAGAVRARTKNLGVPKLPPEPSEKLDVPEKLKMELETGLTMEGAVRWGLWANRHLRADLRRIGVTRGERVDAAILANPTVEVEFLPERDSEYELRLEYEITQALFSASAARAYEPLVRADQLMAGSRALGLALEIRTAFARYQLSKLRVEVAEQAKKGHEAALGLSEELLRVGNATPLETSLNRVAYQKANVLVGRLRLLELEARQHLAQLLSVSGSQVKVVGELEEPKLDSSTDAKKFLEQATARNLELQALEAKTEGLGRRAGFIAARGWVPKVAADVHALRTRPEANGEDAGWRWGGGVAVEVPLFDRGQGAKIALESELGASLEEYYGLKVRLGVASETLLLQSEATRERVRLFEQEILPAQKEAYEQMRLQYNAMQLSLYDLLRAKQERLALELEYYDAKGERIFAELERLALLAGATVEPGSSGSSIQLESIPGKEGH